MPWCANKGVTPCAFIAQVRPPPEPCTLLGPNAGGSGPATRRPGPAYSHPCLGPPSRLRPARRSRRSSRFSGNQRAVARLRGSRRGQGDNTPDATAAWPAGCPRDSGTSQAEEAAQGHRPASRTLWGQGGCYLPWARPVHASAALLATAVATPRPKAERPSDSSQRAPRPRRRWRRRLWISAPGPFLSSQR